ncbi:hypothetical protein O3M35_011239 [Rhynocoris fuscipes]|uniref:Uncharacterized protein n=1 Tax=Rhynocoris fuscipes TaxID=488301 RepID=A0AAW1CXD4_9HEMI
MPQCSTEEIQEKPNKKKRWWGDLFRRSSKSRRSKPSDSSSEEEETRKRGFLGRKRHSDRGSKDVTNSFLINPGLRDVPRGRSLDSVKSPERSSKRRIKAKVEASRELLRDSSSDEASSYTTSSLQSGGGGSFPRRSRAARTERHIRRLSRDLEGQTSSVNKSKWSANVVYQECKEYDRKYRAKARSATPSPAQSPKVKRQAGRATSFDNIKSSPPPPPPRKLPEQRPLSLDNPMRVYNPPVYTAPPQLRTKSRFQPEFVSEPWLPSEQSPEDSKKPPAAPPRKQNSTEERRKQQNNLEEALNELEAIYKKLASEDGQDNQSEMTDSSRPVEDDMAYRRLNKREPSTQDMRDIMSQAGSYLLVSPTLSPPPIIPVTPVSNGQEPDIINDDVVYRTMQHTNNTLKISDPQPPFGIPIGPISPSPPSDYLHKEAKPRFDYKPAKTPDIDRDDLAFRNLRKDAGELKKKKAVRSLSANLTNFISNNNNFNVQNNNLEGKSYSFQDISEELRLSQHALNMRRKKEKEEEEAHQRYLSELYASENELLRELEEEARATSVQMDQELRQLELNDDEPSVEAALYSRSMTDLINELTKNIESNYNLGFSNENRVVVANCQTCDQQTTKPSDCNKKKPESNTNHLSVNNNRRLEIAQSRRQFFESQSPHFNKKIERDSFEKSSIKLNKNSRQYEKENPFLRYYRSPSNPETSYNEKFVNGYDYRLSRSPLRTSSADSSACKENIQSFIERPFHRTSRSTGLESSKSFNERRSPKLSRSPLLGLGNNGKPISFSSERDFLDKERNFEQFSRSQATRSPVNLTAISRGKLYQDYGRSDAERSREKTLSDLRQKLRSPVNLESSEHNGSLVDRYIRGRSPISADKESGAQVLDPYRRLYKSDSTSGAYTRNKTFDGAKKSEPYISNGLLNSKSYQNTLANFDLPSNTSTNIRTHSEDNSFYKVSDIDDIDKEISRSFDSGLMSLIKESTDEASAVNNDRSRLEEENLSKTKYLDSKSLVLQIMRSPCAEMMKELSDDGAQDSGISKRVSPVELGCSGERSNITVKEYPKPFIMKESVSFEAGRRGSGRRSLSPTVEAVQKRKSYAGSADTQIDEQFPREVEQLKPPRSPIDVEAIERDSSSREPSPRNSYTGCSSMMVSGGGNDSTGSSTTTGLVNVASSNEVTTNWCEEDSKQGESQNSTSDNL